MRHATLLTSLLTFCAACTSPQSPDVEPDAPADTSPAQTSSDTTPDSSADAPGGTVGEGPFAHVTAVSTSGSSFSVTISSDETGCDRYADWWEVVSADGTQLVYRRILAHSHVSEQPFTRSGGPVDIPDDREVVVRAHMNPTGYGGGAMRGSVAGGFTEVVLDAGFGAALETAEPLPSGCAF